jgi:hypothetical protein
MPTSGANEPRIYQLKITLRHIRPPIWRRVLVPGDMSLGELHDVIQAAMGWQDYHLHQFAVGNVVYGMDPEEDADWGLKSVDERQFVLQSVAPRGKARFSYEYDFGDGWHHDILVEKIIPREKGARYPVCLAGKRATPPEDSGGPYVYDEFLEALRDPKHPDHEQMVQWAGGFDPERFDLPVINARLARVRQRQRKRTLAEDVGAEVDMAAALVLLKVPKALRERAGQIIDLTDRFCAQHLDSDYVPITRRVLGALARKRPSPLAQGEPKLRAAAVLHLAAAFNAAFDLSPELPPRARARQLVALGGVPAARLWQESRDIIWMLRLNLLDLLVPRHWEARAEFIAWLMALEEGFADARFPPPALQDLIDRLDAFEELLDPFEDAASEPRLLEEKPHLRLIDSSSPAEDEPDEKR